MNDKFSNSDIMYIKNFKDTKIASDLENFHTVGLHSLITNLKLHNLFPFERKSRGQVILVRTQNEKGPLSKGTKLIF